MTVEQEKRLRELPTLIDQEKNPDKVLLLADELRDLTTLKLAEIRLRTATE